MKERKRTICNDIPLYKYCSIDSAIKILNSSSILLNEPANFNDPFDSAFAVDKSNIDKAKKLMVNYYIFLELDKLTKRKDLSLNGSQKVLLATVSKEINACKMMIIKSKSYTMMPLFNKAFDWFLKKNPAANNAITKAMNDLDAVIAKTLDEIRAMARITCFSKRNDSILMWSHYASSHEGVCIEFENDKDIFKEVKYQKRKAKLDLFEVAQRILAYNFIGKPVELEGKIANKILNPFFIKSTDWSYEEEVRCVLSRNETNINNLELKDDILFLKLKIKRIFIGSKAKKEELTDLICLAEDKDIPIVYMKESEDEFRIIPK